MLLEQLFSVVAAYTAPAPLYSGMGTVTLPWKCISAKQVQFVPSFTVYFWLFALVPAPLVLWSSAADSVMELLRCICLFARIREPNSLLSLGVEVCLGLGKVHETTSEGAVAASSDNRLKLAQRACC